MPGVVNATPYSACVQLQSYLATKNQSGNLALNLGAHEALLSEDNRMGFEIVRQDGKGYPIAYEGSPTDCKIILKYIDRICNTNELVDICSSISGEGMQPQPNPIKRIDFQFASASYKAEVIKLDETQFNCICDSKDMIVKEVINQYIRKIFTRAENNLLSNMWDCAGRAGNCEFLPVTTASINTTALALNIFNTNGNAAQPAGWAKVFEGRDSMKMQGRPKVIGGRALNKYIWMTQNAGLGLNSLNKSNLGSDIGIDFYYSTEFDSFMASKGAVGDFAFVMMPGTAQLITYLDNVGFKQRSSDTNTRNVIQYANNGINYDLDMEIYYDEKCHAWYWNPKILHEAFCMPNIPGCLTVPGPPTDIYDFWTNVNGRYFVKLGCGDVSCSPLCPAS